jgi:hypothetical protein
MSSFFLVTIFFAINIIFYLFAQRSKFLWLLMLGICGFVVVPFYTIAFSVQHNLFIWIKYYLLVGSCFIIFLIKYTDKGFFAKNIRPIMLFLFYINIAEAVGRNALSALSIIHSSVFPWYFFALNALCGAISIITMPRSAVFMKKEFSTSKGKKGGLLMDALPWYWILAYLSWNWLFIFLEWPDYVGIQTAVILSSVVPCFFLGKSQWVECRAATITFGLIMTFALGDAHVNMLLFENYRPNLVFTGIFLFLVCLISGYNIYRYFIVRRFHTVSQQTPSSLESVDELSETR